MTERTPTIVKIELSCAPGMCTFDWKKEEKKTTWICIFHDFWWLSPSIDGSARSWRPNDEHVKKILRNVETVDEDNGSSPCQKKNKKQLMKWTLN